MGRIRADKAYCGEKENTISMLAVRDDDSRGSDRSVLIRPIRSIRFQSSWARPHLLPTGAARRQYPCLLFT
jgi:hypothetical protein